ncbi:MAG TPA: thioredoxin family protein, partial [Alphaproteobacteria bacterium]|nr:thioredoxin family protein [Alphaproteobacteria bacterium]
IREVKDIAVINDQVINNSENSASIWYFILAALLGGLILNVMPCVLPVLSLKLINLFQHKETSYRNIRLSFLATAAGILFSFASLAGFLGILQKSGQAIGWGIQFQEPIFIALLAFIIVFFAAIMWGWVQLSGPSFNITVPRDQKARTPSFAQSFSTGFLATLMATPCSAPFVSTAVGFALSQEPLILLLILLFMGVGLAMPYMLVAAFPVIAHWLPKPGRWMVTVKNLMGLLLLFTVGWLVWILFAMIDGRWVVSIIMLLAATLIMLGIKKRYYNGNFNLTLAIWLVVMPALIWTAWNAPEKNTQLLSDNTGWVAFNEHDIPGLVAQGKTVFVDVTAAWCLTCIANKKFVLENPSIIEALQQKHVIAMRAANWSCFPHIAGYR